MTITREIGLKYLWFDTLCIIQDSENDKYQQIDRMDSIYSLALLTIVAASGHPADVGLPGVNRSRKIAQRVEPESGQLFALPLPDSMSPKPDRSLFWNSRSWTYQEKVFVETIACLHRVPSLLQMFEHGLV